MNLVLVVVLKKSGMLLETEEKGQVDFTIKREIIDPYYRGEQLKVI